MPMLRKDLSSAKGADGQSTSPSSTSKPTNKRTPGESTAGSAPEDPSSGKDVMKGAMRSGAPTSSSQETRSDDSSSRSDRDSKNLKNLERSKALPPANPESEGGSKKERSTNAKSSSNSDRSASPTKKIVNPDLQSSANDPLRANVVDLRASRDPEKARQQADSSIPDAMDSEILNQPPSSLGAGHPPPIHFDGRINIEEELAAAQALQSHGAAVVAPEFLANSDSENENYQEARQVHDYELAIRLDKELNAPDVQMKDGSGKHVEPSEKDMPGKYSENSSSTTDAQASASQGESQSRSSSGALAWLGGSNPDRQIDKLKEKVASLKKKLEHAEDGVNYYHKAAQQERAAHTRTWNACKALEMELNGARRHIHHMEEELRGARFELGAVKQQLSDAVNLSEVRGKELKGAQVFLTKADTLSTTDVIQKVHALNEEVFQASALLGEMLLHEAGSVVVGGGGGGEGTVDRSAARHAAIMESSEKATWMLGERMVQILAAESMKPVQEGMGMNSLLVQIVMGAALTQWCAFVCPRWTPGNTKSDDVIDAIYEEIRETEDQAVAGRWRSLTRAHLHTSTQDWTNNIMLGLLAVMQVAGWATRTNEDVEQFEKRLPSIFKAVLDLRKATGEDVTSTDLELTIIDPGTTFDAGYMEDAYADGRAAKGKKGAPEMVLCTSGLGLKRISVKRSSKAPTQKVAEMLAFPKVVLEKTIKEALEPPPPTRLRKKKNADGPSGGGLTSYLPF